MALCYPPPLADKNIANYAHDSETSARNDTDSDLYWQSRTWMRLTWLWRTTSPGEVWRVDLR
jgi:hypothetical protein